MRIDKGLFGCLGACYLLALFFLAAAWFGPFWGFGDWHGLAVLFSPDLVETTGKVIRVEHVGISGQVSTPVIEYSVQNRRIVFRGEGSNTHGLHRGDEVPVAYRRSDPAVAYIRTFEQRFAVPLLMMLFASPFLALALWGTYSNLPGQREARAKSLIVPAGK
jgi:hypothetical protein